MREREEKKKKRYTVAKDGLIAWSDMGSSAFVGVLCKRFGAVSRKQGPVLSILPSEDFSVLDVYVPALISKSGCIFLVFAKPSRT